MAFSHAVINTVYMHAHVTLSTETAGGSYKQLTHVPVSAVPISELPHQLLFIKLVLAIVI